MSFGQRLCIVRKQKNLTQKELGNLIGMVPDLVSRYERDAMMPSIEVAARFSKALNISLDYLVLGIEYVNSNTSDAMQRKLESVLSLPAEDLSHVLAVIDAFLIKFKAQAIFQQKQDGI